MKDIPNYENLYAITNDGKIWSYGGRKGAHMNGHFLSQSLNRGYPRVTLFKDTRKGWLVHQLMGLTYLSVKRGETVDHIDGDKTNNSLVNLEVVSRSENTRRGWKLGLIKSRSGENNGNAKLTRQEIELIRKIYPEVKSQYKLAEMFGVSQFTIHKILSGKTWSKDNADA